MSDPRSATAARHSARTTVARSEPPPAERGSTTADTCAPRARTTPAPRLLGVSGDPNPIDAMSLLLAFVSRFRATRDVANSGAWRVHHAGRLPGHPAGRGHPSGSGANLR